jgi:PAS domain S-box-containing protein
VHFFILFLSGLVLILAAFKDKPVYNGIAIYILVIPVALILLTSWLMLKEGNRKKFNRNRGNKRGEIFGATLSSVAGKKVSYYYRPESVLYISHDANERQPSPGEMPLYNSAEEELALSEERYKNLFNNSPASIYIWDMDSLRILEVNDTAITHYGYSREEFCNLDLLDLRLPENHAEIIEYAKQARMGHVMNSVRTWKHIRKSGEEIYMHIASHKIIYKDRYVMMAMANDVTDRVLLEEKLRKERLVKQFEITDAVIAAQENERKEIGRELHDNINQLLTSSRLYMEMAGTDPLKNTGFIQKAEELLKLAISEIRTLSHSLIPPSISETALTDALEDVMATITETTNIKVNNQFGGFVEKTVSEKFKLTVYRIVQEQVNNILKHAGATQVSLQLIQRGDQVMLDINDNGVGFDTGSRSNGVGLINIRTRASLLNGSVEIISSPGNGCRLRVLFPGNEVYNHQ